MNNLYEYETRMNQIRDDVEKAAREAWKTSPQAPPGRLVLQLLRSLTLWLQKL
ncbi:hypothetical protein ACFOLF_25470 [Paenibacillus sepulcri]|uniref:Uncharacterized protein n=1 Tax=Paenibacillus sepulcri TaxID=359917 RepID=A0ABS7BYR5_9BACL|nr:hypothetical protein [Paenibacillus sepulcri]